MAFFTEYPPGPAATSVGASFLSTRRPGGWSTLDVVPPQSVQNGIYCFPGVDYSPDLSKSVLEDGWNWGEGYPKLTDWGGTTTECGHDEPLLVPGEPQGAQNLFLHDSDAPAEAGFYQLLNQTPPGLAAQDAYFQAGSADFSHILFTSPLRLTPEAPAPGPGIGQNQAGEDLYEWAGGELRLVTVLPDGEPAWGLSVNGVDSHGVATGSGVFTHALSADGERAFFYAGGEVSQVVVERRGYPVYVGGHLYLRENAAQEPTASGECSQAEPAKACTIQVDAPQGGAGGTDEPHFQWATPDGSKVFFTDESRLTAGSTAASGKPDLYEYDLEKAAGQRLTDLTVNAGEAADVQGLSGISDDGSYVYFVAESVLSGEGENSEGAKAVPGKPNLYLRHAGATTFIATLNAPGEEQQSGYNGGDACDWASYTAPGEWTFTTGEFLIGTNCMTARVSPDGRFIAFNSLRSLTGYDNAVAEPREAGERDNEIFLYEAATNELNCASCDPGGAPPTAPSYQASTIPPPMYGPAWMHTPGYLTRSFSEGGRVFFETTNSLLPADTNEVSDVYEYEAGQLRLISTGTSPARSVFYDASASGNDVFFTTNQGLLSADTDGAPSLYDARVGGGFPEPPPTVVCESEEACHAEHQEPPPTSTPGSAHFEGPGNELRCPKGFAKKHGNCVKVRKHSHRKRHRARSHRSAHLNRGGGK
jgi:hypothetical protein